MVIYGIQDDNSGSGGSRDRHPGRGRRIPAFPIGSATVSVVATPAMSGCWLITRLDPAGAEVQEGGDHPVPDGLPARLAEAIRDLGQRSPPGQVQQVVTERCSIRAYTADELAVLLRRNKSGCSRVISLLCFALPLPLTGARPPCRSRCRGGARRFRCGRCPQRRSGCGGSPFQPESY